MDKEIEIGKRIKFCREEAGITQEELGQTLGLNKSTIQRYESGKIVKIKLPILQAMANTLNVNPNYLALKTNNPKQNSKDNSTPIKNNIILDKKIKISSHELNVIEAYRNKPDMQPVVDKILDVSTTTNNSNPDMREIQNKCDNKTHLVYKAARSNSGKQAGYIEVSQEKLDRLKDAPETDDDFS